LPINHHHGRGKRGEFSDKHKALDMDTAQGNYHALASAGHVPLHQIESYLFTVAALPIEKSVCSLSVKFPTDVAHL